MVKSSKGNSKKVIIGAAAGIVVAGCVMAGAFILIPDTSSQATPETAMSEPINDSENSTRVNDTETVNDVSVTLESYEVSEGEGSTTPADGNVFLALSFRLDNQSENTIDVSTLMSFKANCDGEDVTYSLPGASLYVDNGVLDGSIAKDSSLEGTVVYEVPESWESMQVSFYPNVLLKDCVTFEVNPD